MFGSFKDDESFRKAVNEYFRRAGVEGDIYRGWDMAKEKDKTALYKIGDTSGRLGNVPELTTAIIAAEVEALEELRRRKRR